MRFWFVVDLQRITERPLRCDFISNHQRRKTRSHFSRCPCSLARFLFEWVCTLYLFLDLNFLRTFVVHGQSGHFGRTSHCREIFWPSETIVQPKRHDLPPPQDPLPPPLGHSLFQERQGEGRRGGLDIVAEERSVTHHAYFWKGISWHISTLWNFIVDAIHKRLFIDNIKFGNDCYCEKHKQIIFITNKTHKYVLIYKYQYI